MHRDYNTIWSLMSDDYDEQPYPYDEPFHYGERYLYDYQWYHEKFPEEWAVCHKEGTGPGQCTNCADYGSINGVFIGYCANCAIYNYEGARGRGFIDVGKEISDNDVLGFASVFETYLKDVDIHAIEPIESEYQEPGDDMDNIDDNGNYPEDDMDVGIMNCHFEGGYNDF